MKKLLLLILLLPTVLFSQTTDSWVRFAVQYDFYAPQESTSLWWKTRYQVIQ